jgi:hypothetical protein
VGVFYLVTLLNLVLTLVQVELVLQVTHHCMTLAELILEDWIPGLQENKIKIVINKLGFYCGLYYLCIR